VNCSATQIPPYIFALFASPAVVKLSYNVGAASTVEGVTIIKETTMINATKIRQFLILSSQGIASRNYYKAYIGLAFFAHLSSESYDRILSLS
jgi:hypothetical protein